MYALETIASHPRLLEEWGTANTAVHTTTGIGKALHPTAGAQMLVNDDVVTAVIDVASSFLGAGLKLDADTDLAEAGINSLAALELSAKVSLPFSATYCTLGRAVHCTFYYESKLKSKRC